MNQNNNLITVWIEAPSIGLDVQVVTGVIIGNWNDQVMIACYDGKIRLMHYSNVHILDIPVEIPVVHFGMAGSTTVTNQSTNNTKNETSSI